MFLPKNSIPERKKGTSSPTTVEKCGLELPERFVKKNPSSTAVYHQAGGSEASGGG